MKKCVPPGKLLIQMLTCSFYIIYHICSLALMSLLNNVHTLLDLIIFMIFIFIIFLIYRSTDPYNLNSKILSKYIRSLLIYTIYI